MTALQVGLGLFQGHFVVGGVQCRQHLSLFHQLIVFDRTWVTVPGTRKLIGLDGALDVGIVRGDMGPDVVASKSHRP